MGRRTAEDGQRTQVAGRTQAWIAARRRSLLENARPRPPAVTLALEDGVEGQWKHEGGGEKERSRGHERIERERERETRTHTERDTEGYRGNGGGGAGLVDGEKGQPARM